MSADLEKELQDAEEKRLHSKQKLTQQAQGVDMGLEEERKKLTDKLQELRQLTTGPAAEALGNAIVAISQIASSPRLTAEASQTIVEHVDAFLQTQATGLQEFYNKVEKTLLDFTKKYGEEFEAQKAARQKEYEVLEQLSVYLAKFG